MQGHQLTKCSSMQRRGLLEPEEDRDYILQVEMAYKCNNVNTFIC